MNLNKIDLVKLVIKALSLINVEEIDFIFYMLNYSENEKNLNKINFKNHLRVILTLKKKLLLKKKIRNYLKILKDENFKFFEIKNIFLTKQTMIVEYYEVIQFVKKFIFLYKKITGKELNNNNSKHLQIEGLLLLEYLIDNSNY